VYHFTANLHRSAACITKNLAKARKIWQKQPVYKFDFFLFVKSPSGIECPRFKTVLSEQFISADFYARLDQGLEANLLQSRLDKRDEKARNYPLFPLIVAKEKWEASAKILLESSKREKSR
jgi:hypothetical protein